MLQKRAIAIQQDIITLQVLSSLGYVVLEAGDIIDGLRKIIRYKPDLVVSCLKFPGFNGVAMAEILDLFAVQVPLIFTSNSIKDKRRLNDLKGDYGFIQESDIQSQLASAIVLQLEKKSVPPASFHYSLRQREWADLSCNEDRKRILLVEDSPWLKKACMMALDQMDSYALFSANNGLEGIIKSVLVRPDLILTDLHMPVLDGLAMSEILYVLNQPFPIVFLTGDENHNFQGDIDRIGGILGVVRKKEMRDQNFFLQKIDMYLNNSVINQETMTQEFAQGSSQLLISKEQKFFLEGKGLCTPGMAFRPGQHHIQALQKTSGGLGDFFA